MTSSAVEYFIVPVKIERVKFGQIQMASQGNLPECSPAQISASECDWMSQLNVLIHCQKQLIYTHDIFGV